MVYVYDESPNGKVDRVKLLDPYFPSEHTYMNRKDASDFILKAVETGELQPCLELNKYMLYDVEHAAAYMQYMNFMQYRQRSWFAYIGGSWDTFINNFNVMALIIMVNAAVIPAHGLVVVNMVLSGYHAIPIIVFTMLGIAHLLLMIGVPILSLFILGIVSDLFVSHDILKHPIGQQAYEKIRYKYYMKPRTMVKLRPGLHVDA